MFGCFVFKLNIAQKHKVYSVGECTTLGKCHDTYKTLVLLSTVSSIQKYRTTSFAKFFFREYTVWHPMKDEEVLFGYRHPVATAKHTENPERPLLRSGSLLLVRFEQGLCRKGRSRNRAKKDRPSGAVIPLSH